MELLAEYTSSDPNAKVMVLFGGNPNRRHEVVSELSQLEAISIYGTLSEEEGMSKISELKNVDIVLIGGRYSDTQRNRIRSFVKSKLPNAQITEPGLHYPYSTDAILKDVKSKIRMVG